MTELIYDPNDDMPTGSRQGPTPAKNGGASTFTNLEKKTFSKTTCSNRTGKLDYDLLSAIERGVDEEDMNRHVDLLRFLWNIWPSRRRGISLRMRSTCGK
jgi:hypothetical protein